MYLCPTARVIDTAGANKSGLVACATPSGPLPEERLILSESGVFTPADLDDVARYGARCFLIGESLMRQEDVAAATRAILVGQHAAGAGP